VSLSLVVLVIAQDVGSPMAQAFERATASALGTEARVELVAVPVDPPDEEAAARVTADGVIELTWSDAASRARVHCYLSREQRWVDREISFGGATNDVNREASERGRLLGFAVATMFGAQVAIPEAEREAPREAPRAAPTREAPTRDGASRPPAPWRSTRQLEFSGIASSGIEGNAGGLGAAAALRLAWTEPLWVRAFVAGRAGNIPEAQASTRGALLGGGLAIALVGPGRLVFGARVDGFASYFQATHLSEDDIVPDSQSRWHAGADVLGEAGFRVAGNLGVFAAGGVEAALGKTYVYTHGNRVAVVPLLRAVGELGFRAEF
jgi:hypothetical protein